MFYVLDENNNKVEAYDKQGVLAELEQAIEDGNLEGIASDSAFVDKLRCCVGGGTFRVAFVTQASYNELAANDQLISNCYYFITDDTTCDDIDAQLEQLTTIANGNTSAIQTVAETMESDYRRIDDSCQFINHSNFTTDNLFYDSTKSFFPTNTQPTVDISSLMKEGKTESDIIGIAGSIKVQINTTWYSACFNAFVNFKDNALGSVAYGVLATFSEDLGTILLTFSISVKDNELITVDTPNAVRLSDGVERTINKLSPYNLVLFYK